MGRKCNAIWRTRRTRLAKLVTSGVKTIAQRQDALRYIRLFGHHPKFWRLT